MFHPSQSAMKPALGDEGGLFCVGFAKRVASTNRFFARNAVATSWCRFAVQNAQEFNWRTS